MKIKRMTAVFGRLTGERLELSPLSLTLVCDQDSMYP